MTFFDQSPAKGDILQCSLEGPPLFNGGSDGIACQNKTCHEWALLASTHRK